MDNTKSDIRKSPQWNNIFKLLQDSRYAPKIIDSLVPIKKSLKLTHLECNSIHQAYDNRILFEAVGFAIQGGDTPGTREFTDIVFKYWDILTIYLTKEIREIAYQGYTDSEI